MTTMPTPRISPIAEFVTRLLHSVCESHFAPIWTECELLGGLTTTQQYETDPAIGSAEGRGGIRTPEESNPVTNLSRQRPISVAFCAEPVSDRAVTHPGFAAVQKESP